MAVVVEFYIPDKERKRSIKLLSKHFSHSICTKIETGFYVFTEEYCTSYGNMICMAQSIYTDHVANFLFNCDQDNPTIQRIKSDISDKKINPFNIAFLKPEELDIDKWSKIIERKKTTEEKLKNLPTIEWKKCRDCKNDQFYYYQLQTRSADEPMTTFYTCKKCKKTYKINN